MINHGLQDERDELEKKLEVSQETIKRLELQIVCLRNGIDFDKLKLNIN